MKKAWFLFLAFMATTCWVQSQSIFFGHENLIYYSDTIAPAAIDVKDLDGDTDPDVLFALDGKILWYENLDGSDVFEKKLPITTCANSAGVIQVHVADLDGDNDQDILTSSCQDSMVVWLENIDGQGNYGPEQIVHASAKNVESVYTSDLDGDGDLDVLTASFNSNEVGWHENTDGNASFGPRQIISSSVSGARSVYSTDVDEDGDQDVLVASYWNNKIFWFENTDGAGTFGPPQQITDKVVDIESVYTNDLDGDGDPDVLSASSWDNKIAWYENTDGKGAYGKQRMISSLNKDAIYVRSADLDQDGDQDVLSAFFEENTIGWYENTDGKGTFSSRIIISEKADGPGFVCATDLDGDGDLDVLSASTDFKIAWHENTLPLKILENPRDTSVTPESDVNLKVVGSAVDNYQWQVDTGNGYTDVLDNSTYSGAHKDTLYIQGTTFAMSENTYRCILSRGDDSLVSEGAVLKVGDMEKPTVISSPGDQLLEAKENCQITLPDYRKQVEATDNYDDDLDISQSPDSGSVISRSSVEVVLTITDDYGNSVKRSFVVEAVDSTPPVITSAYEDQTLAAESNCQATLPDYTTTVYATDNCYRPDEITINQDPAPYTQLLDATTKVTLTVTDQEGNSSQDSFYVDVQDQTAPVIACPDDQVIQLKEDQSSYTVSGNRFDLLSMADNCATDSVVNSYNQASSLDGAEFGMDTTDVVWTVTDKSGNKTECSFEVQVRKASGIRTLQQNGISVYPNPTTGIIHYETNLHPINRVKILDLSGRVLLERSNLQREGTIDMSELHEGIYHLTIMTDHKVFTIKIVKE